MNGEQGRNYAIFRPYP